MFINKLTTTTCSNNSLIAPLFLNERLIKWFKLRLNDLIKKLLRLNDLIKISFVQTGKTYIGRLRGYRLSA